MVVADRASGPIELEVEEGAHTRYYTEDDVHLTTLRDKPTVVVDAASRDRGHEQIIVQWNGKVVVWLDDARREWYLGELRRDPSSAHDRICTWF